MRYLLQFQINIFALGVLIVLFMIMRMRSKVASYGKKLLTGVMVATAVAIVVEPLTWIFDAEHFFGAYFLEYSTNIILFMMGPILGGLMLSYVDYSIYKDRSRVISKKYYQHLSAITFIVLIFNHFVPVYFHINPMTNRFSSGPYQVFHYLVIIGLYLYMLFFIYRNRKKTFPYVINIFLGFFALPVIGMLIQLFNSRLHFSWTSMVIGCLVAYTFLESAVTEQDFLTKLYNRQSYETYTQHLMERNLKFGVVLIDLNHFKEINDVYGHHEGDLVLIEFGQALQKVFTKESLVARLGGDEFMIVLESTQIDLDSKMNAVTEVLKKHKNANIKSLSFSYGFQMHAGDMSFDDLYKLADEKMYHQKSKTR